MGCWTFDTTTTAAATTTNNDNDNDNDNRATRWCGGKPCRFTARQFPFKFYSFFLTILIYIAHLVSDCQMLNYL